MFVPNRGTRLALSDLKQMKLVYHVRKLGQQNHESFVLQMQIRCDLLHLVMARGLTTDGGKADKLLPRCATVD